MTRLILPVVAALFFVSPCLADECKDKAVGKDGKPLVGAALASNLKKCRHDGCDTKAISSTDGRRLSGAAYNSFMTKCEKDAGTAP